MYGRHVTKVFQFIKLMVYNKLILFFKILAIKKRKEIEEEKTKVIYGEYF